LEAKVEERTKQLEITAVEANSANKAKSEFLASMSMNSGHRLMQSAASRRFYSNNMPGS